MFAYAPDGTKIVGTLETQTGVSNSLDGTFKRLPNGDVQCCYTGQTDFDHNGQQTVTRDGETIFVDQAGDEWPASQLVLRHVELEEGEELDPSEIPTPFAGLRVLATYTILEPEDGRRSLDSFSADEKRRLRPIAETLAMLDGNSFFGATQDENGDDTHYEQYLPEAAALVATTAGCDLASFMRGDQPLPPMIFDPIELYNGERIHDFTDGSASRQLFKLSNIQWDTSDGNGDEAELEGGRKPYLPAEMIVAVEANVSGEDIDFCDYLSDRFGYCVKGLSFDELTELEECA